MKNFLKTKFEDKRFCIIAASCLLFLIGIIFGDYLFSFFAAFGGRITIRICNLLRIKNDREKLVIKGTYFAIGTFFSLMFVMGWIIKEGGYLLIGSFAGYIISMMIFTVAATSYLITNRNKLPEDGRTLPEWFIRWYGGDITPNNFGRHSWNDFNRRHSDDINRYILYRHRNPL